MSLKNDSTKIQFLKQSYLAHILVHHIDTKRARLWSTASSEPVCNFWLGIARKLFLPPFFIVFFGKKGTDAWTKSFHRRFSYKIDSDPPIFMPQNRFQAYREANPHLFGVDSDFSDSESENEETEEVRIFSFNLKSVL